jgi:hypothetical protein
MSGRIAAVVIAGILVCAGILIWGLITDPHLHCVAAGKVLICWRDHR